MSHPLDLHPLHAIAEQAWSVVRQPQQPIFTDLPVEYRSRLLRHAENVQKGVLAEGDGPLAQFELVVSNLLTPPEVQEEVATESVELKGKLPEDFPAYEKLYQEGIHTYGQLFKLEDVTEVNGIGPAMAKKIDKRVKAERKALNK